MARPGIEPMSPGSLANTLPTGPMSSPLDFGLTVYIYKYVYRGVCVCACDREREREREKARDRGGG